MCGIVGILKIDGTPVDPAELERLNETMYHRGPDDSGSFVENGVGLAMRRLSIIDLSTGHQPKFSSDGNLVIVFNRGINNYREIRDELISRGRRFQTQSDTETVLNGYIEWGPSVLDRLNGMWGLAIYDRKRRELFLSRDRLGCV